MKWDILERESKICSLCDLSKVRDEVSFGEGEKTAKVMFVFSRPCNFRDKEVFAHALGSLDIKEKTGYFTSLIKCEIPNNREVKIEEYEACLKILRAQFSLIRPKIIVCLGRDVVKYMIGSPNAFEDIRGQWIDKKGTLFIGTYGMQDLADDNKKLLMWEDLKRVKEKLYEIDPRV